ncbi:hypothetical protein B0O99DRAFT_719001 [Bisporella sp. PMI_857]|nr:hypothetical protein B0O99DRAFT_719001 [Bisporella sp. PMI_857]
MDHLPWYRQSSVSPVKVPFICGDEPICRRGEFLEFPERQGWKLGESESLAQLSKRAQAWIFFGLLAVVDISPDACVIPDKSSMAHQIIDTSLLSALLRSSNNELPYRDSPIGDISGNEIPNGPTIELQEALARAEDALKWEVIPLLRDYEDQEPLNLWSSTSFAILFSIDVLMNTLAGLVRDRQCKNRRSELLFSRLTKGVARSLLHVGKCGSLACRLDLNSSDLYHLMSLPGGSANEDHSQCSKTSCDCFNMNRLNYRPQHTEDCVMCEDIKVLEAELVHLIQNNDVPLVRSTMDSDGNFKIVIEKMSAQIDYTAISHVWAGGLGNFESNRLPHCQLKAIHQDVCNTIARASDDRIASLEENSFYPKKQIALLLKSRKSHTPRWCSRRIMRTTCHYWMDTLCIPVKHPKERELAIGSMGRIYAGAANVLALDPSLRRTSYECLGDESERNVRANMLVAASPWMARSWPLQEAALAPAIYVKFADCKILYKHSHLGIAATLASIPNQEGNERYLNWFNGTTSETPRELCPYGASSDFIQVWNLLAKRTTSYPDDVPAIFAALLHRSARETFDFEPQLRTRAILGSVECLPLDILCVPQKKYPQDQTTNQTLDWIPEFPGSTIPVPLLNSRWGTLRRVANGFIVDLNSSESTTTRALVFPGILVESNRYLLRDICSMEIFLIHVDRPPSAYKAKAGDVAEESRLLLLLSKEHPGIPLMYHGVLCTIVTNTGDTMKVRVDITVGWSTNTDHLPNDSVVDCCVVDPPCSILIEMDLEHWPVLKWSRFIAFPYQDLQAQSKNFEAIYCCTACFTWSVSAGISLLTSLSLPMAKNVREDYYIWLYTLFAFLAILPRMYLTRLEGLYFETAIAREAQHIWASSFWDVDKTRETLSRLQTTVSFNIVGDLLSSDELSDVPSDLFEANHEYIVEIPLEIRYSTKSGKAYGSCL